MAIKIYDYQRDRIILVSIILFLLVLVGKTIYFSLKINALEKENAVLQQKILQREERVTELKKSIDTLTFQSNKIVTKIKTIKVKEYEQIKIVDSMPISGIQGYFTDRYER